jgi:hypothetical protein
MSNLVNSDVNTTANDEAHKESQIPNWYIKKVLGSRNLLFDNELSKGKAEDKEAKGAARQAESCQGECQRRNSLKVLW